jgi:hypothetical protein
MLSSPSVAIGRLQIFNTYGMLSNSALLHRYGFTEPNNPFDIVNVELATVSDICCQSFTQRHFRRRVNIWRKTGCEPCSSEGSEYFEITADGRPQAELLMLLYIIHLPDPACYSLLFEDDLVGKATCDVVAENENKLNAVGRVARVLGWSKGLCSQRVLVEDNNGNISAKPGKRKRQTRSSNLTKHETEMLSTTNRKQKKNPSKEPATQILGELDCWLLTIPVCRCLMSLLLERNSLYPQEEEVSMTKSVQMRSGKKISLKDSVDYERTKLENTNCEQDPKLFHALSLRLSEQTILLKCWCLISERLKSLI